MCILFATVSVSLAVYLHVFLAVILYNEVFHCSCEHIVLLLRYVLFLTPPYVLL